MQHPVFLCDQVQDQWTFWCPFCQFQHWHSAGPGHRVSHCFTPEGKEAMPNGYVLRKRDTDDDIKRAFSSDRPTLPRHR
jgi:hypothetical protein